MNKILIILAVMVFACDAKKSKEEEKPAESSAPAIKNERPVMTITLSTGDQINAQDLDKKMILVLFQPDCNHCQDEAKQIKNRLEAFRDYDLYFVSSHPMGEVNKFAKEYGLADQPNVHFGWTSVEGVLNNFGAITAPSIYIYTKEGRLVESFEGEVDVEMIVRYL